MVSSGDLARVEGSDCFQKDTITIKPYVMGE